MRQDVNYEASSLIEPFWSLAGYALAQIFKQDFFIWKTQILVTGSLWGFNKIALVKSPSTMSGI